MNKKRFEIFLRTFESLDDISTFSDEIRFGEIISPLMIAAEREILTVMDIISNRLGYKPQKIKFRVKSPPSQFFKHLKYEFRYEKQDDLLAFRLLTERIEDCIDIYKKLRSSCTIPHNMVHLWNPSTWDYDIGARNTLEEPIGDGYRSLDFYIYIPELRVIAEIQTRPANFELKNDSNYTSYKDSMLKLVKEKLCRDFERVLSQGVQKIEEWGSVRIDSNLPLGTVIRMYGANYNE